MTNILILNHHKYILAFKCFFQIEELYWACCTKIKSLARFLRFVPEELVHLEREMAHLYYCNFSVFQSAPDTWAIDQVWFPVQFMCWFLLPSIVLHHLQLFHNQLK